MTPSRLATVLILALAAVSPGAAAWKAGVATAVITPDEPLWLSGYSSRTKPAEGKVHDLYAKALAVEDDAGARLVLVTLDLGSVGESITENVRRKVDAKHRLERSSLILNVSHTHCAPEVAAERRVFHDLPDAEEAKLVRYISRLEDKIGAAVVAALDGLRPATLTVAQASADFASNRRLPSPTGFINSPNKDGVTDRAVPVLRVTGADGKLLALLFGYACHNTTLAFQLYCGDYAGFAQEAVEARHPGTKALFFMGCGGDQNPYPRHGPMGLQHARGHGQALADAVERALQGPQKEVRGPLRVGFESVTLALEPLPPVERLRAEADKGSGHARRKAQHLLDRLRHEGQIALTQPCPLHAARFGDDLLLLGVGGETVVDYALRCKKEFAGPFVWVAGYCDDVFAYLPSKRVLIEGGYEGRDGIVHQLTPTPFAASVEERVLAGVKRLVEATRRPKAAD